MSGSPLSGPWTRLNSGPQCQNPYVQCAWAPRYGVQGPAQKLWSRPPVAVGFMAFWVQNHCLNLFNISSFIVLSSPFVFALMILGPPGSWTLGPGQTDPVVNLALVPKSGHNTYWEGVKLLKNNNMCMENACFWSLVLAIILLPNLLVIFQWPYPLCHFAFPMNLSC